MCHVLLWKRYAQRIQLSKPPQQAYPDAPDPSMLPPPQFSSPASSVNLLDTRNIGTSGSMTTNIDQAGTEPSLLFAGSEFISTAQGSQGDPQTNFQETPGVHHEKSRFINLSNRSSQPASYVLNRTRFSDSGRLHTQQPEDFWLLPREPGIICPKFIQDPNWFNKHSKRQWHIDHRNHHGDINLYLCVV